MRLYCDDWEQASHSGDLSHAVEAGLISRSKQGRTVTVRLSPQPMREAMEWLRHYEQFWSSRLDRLAAYAEHREAEAQKEE